MNVNNDNVEPETELGLALGFTNQCIRTRLNRDPGAGVNASSRLETTFVASDPISELVWSPHKGLSLKCAECNLTDKQPSLLWDVRPSNTELSPPQSVTSREDNDVKPVGEINLFSSEGVIHEEGEIGDRACLAGPVKSGDGEMKLDGSSHEPHTGTSGNMEELNNVVDEPVLHINQKEQKTRENEGRDSHSPSEDNSGKENRRTADFLLLRTNVSRPDREKSEPLSEEFNKVMMANFSGRIKYVTKGSQEVAMASDFPSVKECEAVDSPMQNLISPGRKDKKLASNMEGERKSETKTHVSTSVSPLEKLEYTAENDLPLLGCRDACGQREEGLQKEKSPSLEASENSRVRLYRRKGKEKALSDHDFTERKSEEKDDSHESVESCNSTGLLFSKGKRQGSFEQLTVGSKRVKKQIQESPGSTSLVGQDSSFMKWISNMVKGLTKSSHDESPSLALTLAHPDHGHGTQCNEIITCKKNPGLGNSSMGFQTFFQSMYCPNTKVPEGKVLNGDYPKEGSKEFVMADKTCDTKITILPFREKNYSENNNSDPPSEERAISNVNDPLQSLWITRYSQKTHGPTLSTDHSNPSRRRAPECSTDCTRSIPHIQNCVDFSSEQKSSDVKEYITEDPANTLGKEVQNVRNFEAVFGLKRIRGRNDQKLIPLLPSPKIKSSEVMASVFARRLDAFKHIIPSDVRDYANSKMTTCLFCGRDNHDLRDCSEITRTEVDDLLKNMSSYDGVEESSCLCIRCFKLDHWAISCPMVAFKVQRTTGKERYASANTICTGKRPHINDDSSRNPKCYGIMISDKRVSDSKHTTSCSGENELKTKQIMPLCHFNGKQISDVPGGMFEAVRRLRLSRTDILKWMNSHSSHSLLGGFFLRLRLGKWEEGLGGTGYYVACITGAQREDSSQNSKNPISVNVCGIKCLVGTQYISNHDFLEDELMAWWSSTSRSGGNIPSEDDLKLKCVERKSLGF